GPSLGPARDTGNSPMTDGPRRPTLRLLLLLIVPALVLFVRDLPRPSRLGADPARRLDDRSERVTAGFASILVATTALEESLSAALDPARPAPGPELRDRLEGVGILGPSGRFLEWEGTPPE